MIANLKGTWLKAAATASFALAAVGLPNSAWADKRNRGFSFGGNSISAAQRGGGQSSSSSPALRQLSGNIPNHQVKQLGNVGTQNFNSSNLNQGAKRITERLGNNGQQNIIHNANNPPATRNLPERLGNNGLQNLPNLGNQNVGNRNAGVKQLTERLGNLGQSNNASGGGLNPLDNRRLTDRIRDVNVQPGIQGPGNPLNNVLKTRQPQLDLSNIARIGKNGQLGAATQQIPIGNLSDLARSGRLDSLLNTQTSKKLDLKKQFDLAAQGDVARRLNLVESLRLGKGVQGLVRKDFCDTSFSCWYAGPKCFSDFCWTPKWCSWVDWCWWDHCHAHCDPRPIFCRPRCFDPCDPWVFWHCPVWIDLHGCYCGTWVNCPPVVVEVGMDLQLLAVRFVDAGHPEQKLGPRFRAWVRNNSPAKLMVPFNVVMIASNGPQLQPGLPEAGVRIPTMEPGQILPVDIRLPFEANVMGLTPDGHRVPFSHLTTIVDAHREVVEVFEANNGATLLRGDILPVDPAAFAAEVTAVAIGAPISVAGEGFGPEPGQVIITVNGLELQGVIVGWYDLGVRFQVPNLPLAAPAEAQVVIVRRDGAAANPVLMTLVPAAMAPALPPAPAPAP